MDWTWIAFFELMIIIDVIFISCIVQTTHTLMNKSKILNRFLFFSVSFLVDVDIRSAWLGLAHEFPLKLDKKRNYVYRENPNCIPYCEEHIVRCYLFNIIAILNMHISVLWKRYYSLDEAKILNIITVLL